MLTVRLVYNAADDAEVAPNSDNQDRSYSIRGMSMSFAGKGANAVTAREMTYRKILLHPNRSDSAQHVLQGRLGSIAHEHISWEEIVKAIIEKVQKKCRTQFGKPFEVDGDDNQIEEPPSPDLSPATKGGFEAAHSLEMNYSTVQGMVEEIQTQIIDVLNKELHHKLALRLTPLQRGLIF